MHMAHYARLFAGNANLIDDFLAANSFTEKQMGQAMGMFMKAHGQTVDPAVVNPLIKQKLGWAPSVSLREGMQKTYRWIYEEMHKRSGERRTVQR